MNARTPQPATTDVDDPRRRRRDLLLFFHSGRRPDWSSDDVSDLLPVPMQPYREASRVRTPYPLCRIGPADYRPLSQIIDDLVDRIDEEGDVREKLVHDAHRLEAALKQDRFEGTLLTDAWESAAERITASSGGDAEADNATEARLSELLSMLDVDGPLLDCEPAAVLGLFRHRTQEFLRLKTDALRDRAATLRNRLEEILEAEHRTQPPSEYDHAEIDAARFRDVVRRAHLDNPLPDDRRERLVASITELAHLEGASEELFKPFVTDGSDSAEGVKEYVERMRRVMTDVVRVLQTADLEAAGRYRADEHDAYFDHFSYRDVAPGDLPDLPRPVVIFDARQCETAPPAGWFDCDLPVCVLVLLPDPVETSLQLSPWTRFAGGVAVASTSFAMQTCASNVGGTLNGIDAALRAETPALVAVYAAISDGPAAPYFSTAAAHDGRLIPTLRFDPNAGPDWAARFDLSGNVQPEEPWPLADEALESDDEAIPFTAVDALVLDPRFHGEFLLIPEDVNDLPIVPLHDWLRDHDGGRTDPGPAAATQIPFIRLAASDGTMVRAAITRRLGEAARRIADWWRTLQEFDGIDSSIGRARLESERQRLEGEKEAELEAARSDFEEQLNRAVSEVARDVVSKIAGGLLNVSATNGRAAPTAGTGASAVEAPPPSTKETPTREEASHREAEDDAVESPAHEEDDDEDDVLVLDEPYVDTPLCTTCNECTNVNGQLFAYNEDKQAYIADPDAGTFRELVTAAELCPVRIIHPGKPRNPDEPGLDELIERARPFQ